METKATSQSADVVTIALADDPYAPCSFAQLQWPQVNQPYEGYILFLQHITLSLFFG